MAGKAGQAGWFVRIGTVVAQTSSWERNSRSRLRLAGVDTGGIPEIRELPHADEIRPMVDVFRQPLRPVGSVRAQRSTPGTYRKFETERCSYFKFV